MKGLLIDKSDDFFLILEKEKSEWPDFYFEYVKNAPYIFSAYHRIFNLNEEDIIKRLSFFERRFVDKVFQSLSQMGPYKYNLAKLMIARSDEFNLSPSDFHIYIVGGLDLDAMTIIDDKNLMIDVLALYRVGFQNIEELYLKMLIGR